MYAFLLDRAENFECVCLQFKMGHTVEVLKSHLARELDAPMMEQVRIHNNVSFVFKTF